MTMRRAVFGRGFSTSSNESSRRLKSFERIRNKEVKSLYVPELDKDSCGVGMLANLNSIPSRGVVTQANEMLSRMAHRGGCGCEPNTGDGAGMLMGLPHSFFQNVFKDEVDFAPNMEKFIIGKQGKEVLKKGDYAAGMVFFSIDKDHAAQSKEIFAQAAKLMGWNVLGWRKVPCNNADLGPSAKMSEPAIEQVFLTPMEGSATVLAKDLKAKELSLYKIRNLATKLASASGIPDFYFCSLSTNKITYKGQLTPSQLGEYYLDMSHDDFISHFALVHSRFSTNTFPSWDRAQPNRMLCHNGEINTLRGNKNWMQARYNKMAPTIATLCAGVDQDALRKLPGYDKLSALQTSTFGILPICSSDFTDSGNVDAVLEMITMTSGRSVGETMLMLIPEAWQNLPSSALSDPKIAAKKAFYEYNSCLMEPWDGPALMAFTDGVQLGGLLDRNGLRPARYYVTKDNTVMLSSEIGVLPKLDHATIKYKGRLEPGKMFLIDFSKGAIVLDEEIKQTVAKKNDYQKWIAENLVYLSASVKEAKIATPPTSFNDLELKQRLSVFGHTLESQDMIVSVMAGTGKEPLGSMGIDAPLAVLSKFPRQISEYFKQLFAQVTNPPIDPIREEIVMSLKCPVGSEGNILENSAAHASRLVIDHPVINEKTLNTIKENKIAPKFKSKVIDITFNAYATGNGGDILKNALDSVTRKVDEAVAAGANMIILSQNAVGTDKAPIPSLLATGCVHHHLIDTGKRTDVAIIVESGDAKEVHDYCTLVGFGADAIHPFISFAAVKDMMVSGKLENITPKEGKTLLESYEENYIKSAEKGMLKVMAKMGISTLQSYKGAQIFEAVGLGPEVVEKCFKGTTSRLGGASFEALYNDIIQLHNAGFVQVKDAKDVLRNVGDFHYRHQGEAHQNDPESMVELQVATRNFDKAAWKRYTEFSKRQNQKVSLRGALRIKGIEIDTDPSSKRAMKLRPIPLEEVEPASEILKRFASGAMSLGSISAEAHETLGIAMNRLKARSNTGEGGEDPKRFIPLPNGDSKRSAIKQVASGRFGVTAEYLANADQVQIKMAQGAKPGEGGELPGHKVTEEIARVRGTTPGVGLISPPPHHDIYSIEDLAQLIHDLKNAVSPQGNQPSAGAFPVTSSSLPTGQVSVKLVSEVGVGIVAAGVAKAKADHIVISGGDGGTGAAAWTGVHRAGLPWELGLAEAQQTLIVNNLRSRVRLQVDGQLKTARDVMIGAMLGAEEFGFSTAPLIAMGCIMMRKCHLNTCPVGIATQDPELRKKFIGVPENVVNFFLLMSEDIRAYMAALGIRRFQDLVGRTDLLTVNQEVLNRTLAEQNGIINPIGKQYSKAATLDLSPLLTSGKELNPDAIPYNIMSQDHELEAVLDHSLIAKCQHLLTPETKQSVPEKVYIDCQVTNANRSLGAMLSSRLAKVHGGQGLPDETINVKLTGSVGQSLGFILMKGITFELEGDANDSVGKGLCGGKIIIYPPHSNLNDPDFHAEDNFIIGNVALYGATKGEAYFSGRAGERFCVRNSGAKCVVEGVGDHGCEYMTGGRVVVLGNTGRNFAAGMSGGIAYVYDPKGEFVNKERCNMEMVALESVESPKEMEDLLEMIEKHRRYTGSKKAARIIDDWETNVTKFVKVMPHDYKRVLAQQEKALEENSIFEPKLVAV